MGLSLSDILLFGKATSEHLHTKGLRILGKRKLFWGTLGRIVEVVVKGVPPLVLPDAIESNIPSLIAFGGTEQGLPEGYTALTFVENSATTLVPLGMSFGTSDFKMEITAVVQNGSLNLFQSQTSGGLTRGIGGSSANTIYGKAGSLNDVSITANNYRTAGHKYAISFTAESGTGTLKVDDLTAETTETVTGTYTTGVVSTEEICLFGNTQAQYVGAGTQIFSAKLWKDGALVLDLIPSRKGATIGFFDLVSRTFKTANTGTLLAGLDTTLAPTPDAPMDIVSNNGVLKVSPNLFDKDSTPYWAGFYISSATVGNSSFGTTNNDNYNIYRITIQPNTTYTFGIIKANAPYWVVMDDNTILDCALNGGGTTGTTITITTPANAKYLYLSVSVNGTYKCDDILQVELGSTATPYQPYGQIYTDGTVETIGVKDSKNLLPVDAQADVLYPVNVILGNSYVASAKINNGEQLSAAEIRYYNQNKVMIDYWTMSNFSDGRMYVRFTINTATKYVSIVHKTAHSSATIADLKFEQGTGMTPYYNGGTATAEMLLKVGNYTDEQEILSGAVTRKVGVKVLDGTESWSRTNASSGVPFATFNLALSTTAAGGIPNVPRCSHFVSATSTGRASIPDNGVGVTTNLTYTIMWFRCDSITATNDFTTWLAAQYAAGTPVIVIYSLATPTTETVTGQPMSTTQGDNIAEITQASLGNLELQVTYMAGVSLTIEEIEDAQLSPDVEVTIL